MGRLNQGLDEGQSGDPRALNLADIRAGVRKMIQDSRGELSSYKASELGKSLVPTMAGSTIMKFASGETKAPSSWTIRKLNKVIGRRLISIPEDAILPEGSIEL